VSSTNGRGTEPVLITEAQPSLDEQLNARRNRYLLMMGIRVLCLVLAAVFYKTPWLLAIFVAGTVVLPWMAVLIANDRPPKKAAEVHRTGGHPAPERAIAPPSDQSRVIDG
jgi:uncharacterized membrane protein